MRKLLSSSNALMVAVLVVLAAVAVWVIVESGEDTVASSETEQPSVRETARGGGPLEGADESDATESGGTESEATDDQAPLELDTPELEQPMEDGKPRASDEEPDLDQPNLQAPALERPVLEDADKTESADESGNERPAGEGERDEVDQEAAFRTDEAPEADVIGVQPADSDERVDEEEALREGGGPIDDREVVEGEPEGAIESDEEAIEADGEDVVEGEADEEVVEPDGELPADEASPQDVDPGVPTGNEELAPPPSEESEEDDSLIERPGLRSAPRPSRPGEE